MSSPQLPAFLWDKGTLTTAICDPAYLVKVLFFLILLMALVTLLVLVYKVTKDKATRTESQTQERSQHCRHESTVLGGDSTEVKIWRPKRQGHLGAVLEPRAWERKAALATQFPQCQMLPPGLSFLSTTSSSIIHTHPAVL